MVSSLAPPGLRRPITTRWTSSRSVRSLAMASRRNFRPFMATSADAVVTRRPGTGRTSGSGVNSSTSTPTGTTAMRSGSTLWSATMSLKEFSDTVMIRFSRRATSVCMSTKLYQRRSVSFLYQLSAASISRRRSTVIGWWIVPSTGMPSWRSMRSSPKPRHWLSWTMSNSPWRWRRWSHARIEKARGSGKVPPMKAVTSSTSFQFFSSQIPGCRIGKWSL